MNWWPIGSDFSRIAIVRDYCNVHAVMDDSSNRLNFDLGKKNKIHYHS
jgi:hypothetical protein